MKSHPEEPSRDFKGIWIPKEIWLNKNLSIEEKVILSEIHSLDGEDGCFASNAYFQNFFGLSQRVLQLHLARLKKLGFIRVESFDGRKRILKTSHEIFYTPGVKKSSPLPRKKLHPSLIGSSIERDNKEDNKDIYNPPLPPQKEKEIPPTEEEEEELDKRFRERPKDSKPVISQSMWRSQVLKDIRSQDAAKSRSNALVVKHRNEAMPYHGKTVEGLLITVNERFVEFCHPAKYWIANFDLPEKEWIKETRPFRRIK